MPKLKTHSGVKKRFRMTASGKVLCGYAHKRHNMRRKPNRMVRQARRTTLMKDCDAKILAVKMPYGLS